MKQETKETIKKIIIWIIMIFFVTYIFQSCQRTDNKSNVKESIKVPEVKIEDKVESPKAKEPKKLEFGKTYFAETFLGNLSIRFHSLRFYDTIDLSMEGVDYISKDYYKADWNYKFAVIDVTSKNIGFEEGFFPFKCRDMKLKVDNGYLYGDHISSQILFKKIRPGDVETGYCSFEILRSTEPIELHIDDFFYGKYIVTNFTKGEDLRQFDY